MSDVLTIAMKRRERLQAEIAKLDQFLRFAVQLSDLELAKADEPRAAIKVPEPQEHLPEAGGGHETDEVIALPEKPRNDAMARASLFRRLNGDGELRKAVG